MDKFPEIVRAYREQQKLSLRAFAAALAEDLPEDGVTYMAIRNWENGKHGPKFQLLLTMAMRFGGWRREFAFDCLAAIQPEYYAPAGEIGRRILGELQNGEIENAVYSDGISKLD